MFKANLIVNFSEKRQGILKVFVLRESKECSELCKISKDISAQRVTSHMEAKGDDCQGECGLS